MQQGGQAANTYTAAMSTIVRQLESDLPPELAPKFKLKP